METIVDSDWDGCRPDNDMGEIRKKIPNCLACRAGPKRCPTEEDDKVK
jgi:hypothetical protein